MEPTTQHTLTTRPAAISGWKTRTGGIALILSGAGQVVGAVTLAPLTIDAEQLQSGLTLIGAGLAALGIGHKIEKAAGPTHG